MASNVAIEAMKSRVRQLLVADLKNVCRDESLAVSGAKGVLQQRITQRIDHMVATNNTTGLHHMRGSLSSVGHGPSLPPLNPVNSSQSGTRNFSSNSSMGYTNGSGGMSRNHISTAGVQFKPSPFFESLEPLARPVELAPYPAHRNMVSINFVLSAQNIERMRSDSSLRVLLYCAAKSDLVNGTQSDVAFPSQLEVKVNEQEVRANFKGLKNKPGSTRPADITAFVTKQPQFTNRISTTYALTQKVGEKPSPTDAQGFTMVAMLVKKRSVDELVTRIQKGKVITREKVLNEMQMKANDPDIVVGSSVMSLKDPVSYVRIAVPCRSDVCSHHQCFDAASFLQLQEQAPTWTCPICNKVVSFEGLVVDQYFEDILQRTGNSTYQVTVDPNGQWSATGAERSSGQNDTRDESTDEYSDDDDLVEVVKPIKRESFGSNATPVTPFSMTAPTPPRASPMVNSASSRPSQGQKRKSEVIDLTLSDDDEPAAKRPAYSTPNSLPDHSRTGRTNGYSYPNNPPSFSNRANGPLRFQIGGSSSSRDSSGSSGNNSNSGTYPHNNSTTQHNDYSTSTGTGDTSARDDSAVVFGKTSFPPSRAGHRPSPLSGTALAPINLTESPPQRTPSALGLYSAGSSYGRPPDPPPPLLPTLPRIADFDIEGFPSPPPIPQSATHTQRANAHYTPTQQSEQRSVLRQLANPFRSDRQP